MAEQTDHQEPEPINDPPIEHDPIGQALLTLPFAVAEGGVELVAWAASETIIPLGEMVYEALSPEEVEASAPNIDIPTEEETTMRSSSVAHEDAP